MAYRLLKKRKIPLFFFYTFQEIRNNILKALTEEYEKKIAIYHNELIAYSHLIQEYFTLQNAGLLTRYTMEEIIKL